MRRIVVRFMAPALALLMFSSIVVPGAVSAKAKDRSLCPKGTKLEKVERTRTVEISMTPGITITDKATCKPDPAPKSEPAPKPEKPNKNW